MYKCNHCDFESDSEKGLKIHTSQMHKTSQKKTYNCDSCGDTFEDYPSRREGRGRENFFCSKSCKNEYEEVEKIDTVCSWCGSDVEKYPSATGEMGDYSIDNHFCDKECESEWKSNHWVEEDHPSWDGGKVDVECEECGSTYSVKPSKENKSRFCSRECSAENRTVEESEIECDQCGETFSRKPYDVKCEKTFCSDMCFNKHLSEMQKGEKNTQWEGGKATYYGSNWNEERRTALADAEYECKLCGMTRDEHYEQYDRDLDVHHRIPIRSFEKPENANFQNNLVVCCRNCHQTVLEVEPVPHNDLRAPA